MLLHVCVSFVVAALMLLKAHLVASAIHLEWKTNTLMKMTLTTGPFMSGFVFFLSLPDSISAFSLLLSFFSFWGVTKVENGHLYFRCICTYLLYFTCLHSTWTKFQTPATSPQLNFTLFKHALCCLCEVANLH